MPPVPTPKGPGQGRMHGKVNFKAFNKKTFSRLMKYLFHYKFSFTIVLICIVVGAVTTVVGATFLQTIIDDYIKPLMVQDSPVLDGLMRVIATMAAVYLAGTVATLLQGVLMARVGQGVLKRVRDEMFTHMQKLPIRYFDSRTFGEVMSHFFFVVCPIGVDCDKRLTVLFFSSDLFFYL